MYVYISHKKEDGATAHEIYDEFRRLGVNSYLDLIDKNIIGGGK